MGAVYMIPTKDITINRISDMTDETYKMVALYVQNLSQPDEYASDEEIDALSKSINEKYAQAFQALAR